MQLWLIKQEENNGYDTYDSAVVAAELADDARLIHPGGGKFGEPYSAWASGPERVTVELLGDAAPGIKAGVILASFNAG